MRSKENHLNKKHLALLLQQNLHQEDLRRFLDQLRPAPHDSQQKGGGTAAPA